MLNCRVEPDTWVAIDPSFKQYEFLEGLDPIEIAGLDPEALAEDFVASGEVNEDESWVTGFDPAILEDAPRGRPSRTPLKDAQAQMQRELEQSIEDSLDDPTVGDVIGGPEGHRPGHVCQQRPQLALAGPAGLGSPGSLPMMRFCDTSVIFPASC